MSKLIGFTGCKGVGKDTAGQFLVHEGFKQIGFADKLKEAVANLFDIDIKDVDEFKLNRTIVGNITSDTIPAVEVILDIEGHTQYSLSWREFLQRFGIEMGRNTFGYDFWLNLALPDFPVVDTVITDVRFDNEAARIMRFGGSVYEITRPGHEPDGHVSEEGIDRDLIMGTITNDGDMDKFRGWVLSAVLR